MVTAVWAPISLRHYLLQVTNPASVVRAAATAAVISRCNALLSTLRHEVYGRQARLAESAEQLKDACQQASHVPSASLQLTAAALAYVDGSKEHVQQLRLSGKFNELDAVQDTLDAVLWTSATLDLICRHMTAAGAAEAPVGTVDIVSQLSSDIHEIHSFCVEKFGCAPAVEISQLTDRNLTRGAVSVRSHVRYIFTELLKNAMMAHIGRWGAAGVDDGPPILVRVGWTATRVSIMVSDKGAGLRLPGAKGISAIYGPVTMFPYFASTVQTREPNYTYSRDFGAPFSGAGTGLARSRLYALLHGGGLSVSHAPGLGTDAVIWMDSSGWTSTDDMGVLRAHSRQHQERPRI